MGLMTAADHRIPQALADTLAQPRAYADGTVLETYRWLREHEPMGVAKIEGVDPFWVATRHADILEISRQNDLFHNGDRAPTLTVQGAAGQGQTLTLTVDATPDAPAERWEFQAR